MNDASTRANATARGRIVRKMAFIVVELIFVVLDQVGQGSSRLESQHAVSKKG